MANLIFALRELFFRLISFLINFFLKDLLSVLLFASLNSPLKKASY